MLNFQTNPPDDPRGNSLHLVRCPTGKLFAGVILSDDMLGTPTHYYKGRTIPCDDEHCPACKDGFPWRWHAYLAVYQRTLHRTVLLEITAKAAEPLKLYRKAYGTLRGCGLTAKRINSAANSRVIITTCRADMQDLKLPDEPNVLEALSIIWNIELPSMCVGGTLKGVSAIMTKRNLDLRNNSLPTNTTPSQSPSPNGNASSKD